MNLAEPTAVAAASAEAAGTVARYRYITYSEALLKPALAETEVSALMDAITSMSTAEANEVLRELDQLDEAQAIERCRSSFLHFCARVYPGFKQGPHHRFLEPILHNVCAGTELRLTVSMAPRFGKSITIAYLFVAWYLGHHPDHHVMMVTHTADLSSSFGRQVRNLIATPGYYAIFPGTVVSRDKSAADDWTTTVGGKYLALGVGGSAAGHGAHLLVADDLVSEQAVLSNPDAAFENAWTYMQVGPLQRLMPGGAIIMIGTRWGKKDPIGKALNWARDNPGSIPWNEVRFPAIMPSGKSLWPEQWPIEQLLSKKAGMQPQYWAAQYAQEPHHEEGAIIKRDWWQKWTKDKPPAVTYIIQSWDTAHDTKTTNDYSACTTWGIWFNEDTNRDEIILLNAFRGRWEFPQLKTKALEAYKEWEPDDLIIEKKAAGAPLIQEMRQGEIPVTEVTPSRGAAGMPNDKRARTNAVAPTFADKCVWAPDRLWANEVIEECAEFPYGENDDMHDTMTQALQRFRAGGFVRLTTDTKEDDEPTRRRRREYY
jgi:predicted phage terminase large subunit-like protein